MKTLSLLSLFLLASCLLKNEPEHDPRFDPIRQQFHEDAKFFGVDINPFNVKIAFGDVEDRVKFAGFIPLVGKAEGNVDGACGTIADTNNDLAKPFAKMVAGDNFKQKYVVINEELEGRSIEFLESLVYHELGHCVLDKSHNDNEAIMNTSGIYEFSNFRYFYIRELFTGESKTINSISMLSDETQVLPRYEVVYESKYSAFSEDINHTLYYDPSTEKYLSLDL